MTLSVSSPVALNPVGQIQGRMDGRQQTKKGTYRVLIVGCGQLGSRHLQAVASLADVREIEVVDPSPESLKLGHERLAEVPDRQSTTSLRWLRSLEEASKGGDLCIIATQADVRCQLLYQVVQGLGYSSFLLEKLVAQSVSDYESLLAYSKEKGLSIWVNCKTRAYPFHKRLKAILEPSEPILLTDVGGNHGLASNGVHAADLFAFYDETNWIEGAGSLIDPILHSSKRGGGMFDLSGTLHGCTSKGSHLIISFASDHSAPDYLSIFSRRYRCIVDHFDRWAWESDSASGWQWRPVSYEGNLLVSDMTKSFAAEILSNGTCGLPTLAGSFPAHRFVLGELQPHFNRLLGAELGHCLVT